MDKIASALFLWAFIGYFMAGSLPKVKGKKSALKQTLLLGPLFWIGLAIWGICVFVKRKILTE